MSCINCTVNARTFFIQPVYMCASEFGFPIDVHIGDTGTPIHAAARVGDMTSIDIMVSLDKSLLQQKTSTTKKSLLHFAARNNHVRMCTMLLEMGFDDVNVRDASRMTPLIEASSQGHWAIVAELLSLGCDTNVASVDMKTPWIHCIEQQQISLLEKVLPPKQSRCQTYSTPLQFAVLSALDDDTTLAVVEKLIGMGEDPTVLTGIHQSLFVLCTNRMKLKCAAALKVHTPNLLEEPPTL